MSTQAYCPYCQHPLTANEEGVHGWFSVVCRCGYSSPYMKTIFQACRIVKKAPPKAIGILNRLITNRDLSGSVVELLIEVRDLLKVEDKT